MPHAPFVDIDSGITVSVSVGEEAFDFPGFDSGVGHVADGFEGHFEFGVVDLGERVVEN